jgi:hypothetical protein
LPYVALEIKDYVAVSGLRELKPAVIWLALPVTPVGAAR